MNKRSTLRKSDGMALLVAMMFIVIATLTLGALAIRVINQSSHVDRYITFKRCFEGVESAFAESLLELETGGDGWVGLDSWTMPNPGDGITLPTFDDPDVSPVQIPSMPNVEYMAFAHDWSNDNEDNNGDGNVDGPEESGFYTAYAFAQCEGVVRSAEVVLSGADVNVWNNAIFAGAGAAGGAINGNVSIHGSVHILGNHVPAGGDAVVVIDMIGASLIHNNYESGTSKITQRQLDSVPPLPQTNFNGEDIDTIDAVLRVKRGRVSLSGSAEIGEADDTGNTYKETLDAIYNEDGWTGNKVVDDGGRGDPVSVFSDNGWDETYDLGDKVPFPLLTDDWRWPSYVNCDEYDPSLTGIPVGAPGSFETSPDGDNYLHGEFFSDVLADNKSHVGDVTLSTSKDLYINTTTGESAVGSGAAALAAGRTKSDRATCVKGDNYLYFDSSTNVLEINGQIQIDGDFEITQKGNDDTIYYTGRAAFLVNGEALLDANMYACENGVPGAYNAATYPINNIFGIMSTDDMTMGVASQLHLMGAFYSATQITCSKQTVVMGTFVSNYFEMGKQVPDIYQVPELPKYLPLGMIGNYPIWAVSQISWRELYS